jgi:recombination protein RecA
MAKGTPVVTTVDPSKELLEGIHTHMEDNGSAMLLGDDILKMKIRGVISTQIPELDAAIGRGGVPFGRLTIVHGGEGSGKTTLCLHLVAEVQRMGGVAVYIDKEYKLDPEYAAKVGVDIKSLIISQPSYLEKVFDLTDGIIKKVAAIRKARGKRIPILIVLDSLNACITKTEFEGEYGDKTVAAVARLLSAKLPKLIPQVSQEDVALVFISQVRQKIGVMFGDDEETAGGKAPKFYASLLIHVKRRGTERDEKSGEKVANVVQFECKKNQIAPPFRKAQVKVEYGKGFNRTLSLINRAIELGVLTKKGSWVHWKDTPLGQSVDKACEYLENEKESMDKLRRVVRKKEGWDA